MPCDGPDTAFCPPAHGGLSSHGARSRIRGRAGPNAVGGDCDALAPPYDPVEITMLAVAGIAQDRLCGMADCAAGPRLRPR